MNENEATAASSAVSLWDEDEDEVGGRIPQEMLTVSVCVSLVSSSSGVSSFFTVFYLTTGRPCTLCADPQAEKNEIALGQS